MYLPFYDLDKAPFQSSFDPEFFWQGKKIHKLLKILKFDFERHTRISLITGNPGCGKTTVIRAALDSLNPSVLVAMVQDSRLSVQEFYDLTGHALELPGPLPTRKIFLKQMLALLHKAEEQGKHVLLVIDEAQQLSPQLIEEIEAIITLGTDDLEGLSVCLVGQLDNADCLKGHLLTFFEKHDMVLHHLAAMTLGETADYIQHRLQIGGTTRKIFTDDAIQKIHSYANGYPVQINNICDLTLFIGESKQATEIDAALILANIDKLQFATRQGDVPTSCTVATAASSDENQNKNTENTQPISEVKPAKKQRISALEVFAKMDKDKKKQEPAPKQSFVLPALGFCLILLLGVGVYLYSNKWAKRPEGLSQLQSMQAQAKQPGNPVSQISVASFTPAQRLRPISPSTPSPNQVDNSLDLSPEKGPHTTEDNPKKVPLQDDNPTSRPTPILRQPDEDTTRGDKLVMPQLQEQIQHLLPETSSDLVLEQPPQTTLEKENQEEVALVSPEEIRPQNRQELTLPERPKRHQKLSHFLAGGSFAGLNKNTLNKESSLNKETSTLSSSPNREPGKKQSEPAPADVIDWLLKKKDKKAH